MVHGSRTIRVAPRVSNLEQRNASRVTPQLVHVPVVRRTRLLALYFALSSLWNLVSPFKTWAITTYGFLSFATTRTVLLEWNTVLNGRFLTQLYTTAGIPLPSPLAADRVPEISTTTRPFPVTGSPRRTSSGSIQSWACAVATATSTA